MALKIFYHIDSEKRNYFGVESISNFVLFICERSISVLPTKLLLKNRISSMATNNVFILKTFAALFTKIVIIFIIFCYIIDYRNISYLILHFFYLLVITI